MQSMHAHFAMSGVATEGGDTALVDGPRPRDGSLLDARVHQVDVVASLRHAQSAFSEALGRYIEL
jgi:hypothetical protein